MTRLWVFALVVLAGCGPAPSGLSPDDAFQAALAAVAQGEVPQALALLGEAAQAGHLDALEYRARAYRFGYLRTDWSAVTRGEPGKIEGPPAFLVLPGQAEAAQADYRRVLESAADAGDTDAMFRFAAMLDEHSWHGTERALALDSARAVYRQLVDLGADPFRLALLAHNLDLDDDHRHFLPVAAQAGDPVACLHQSYASNRGAFSARGVARSIDAFEACRLLAEDAPRPGVEFNQSDRSLSALATQARDGNHDARGILDSLRADGVFERHPRLAAVVAG